MVPKVSSEHLAARREQIIAAATVCFGRNGFHATTMADVIEESRLSAGAVYRYFRGKDELVEAISERALGAPSQTLAELLAGETAPDVADIVAALVQALDDAATSGPVDLRRIALQAWAEALRAPGVMRAANGAQVRLRRGFAQVVLGAQERGRLPTNLDVEAAAQVLQSLVVGRVVQQLLVGDVDTDAYGRAVHALLAPAGHADAGAPSGRDRTLAPAVPATPTSPVAPTVPRAVPAGRTGVGWPPS